MILNVYLQLANVNMKRNNWIVICHIAELNESINEFRWLWYVPGVVDTDLMYLVFILNVNVMQ